MTRKEFEVLYEILGILIDIVRTSGVYSMDLAKRLENLDNMIQAIPIEDE